VSLLPALAAVWLASAAVVDAPPPAETPAAPDPGAAATPPAGVTVVTQDQQAVIQAAYQAAEAQQGPLDGLWRLTDDAGRTLFIFDLNDPGAAPAPKGPAPDSPTLDGAWRDPNRAGSTDASGFIDTVRHDGGKLSIRFVEDPGDRPEVLTLRAGRDGRWTGELAGAGSRQPVVMIHF
jgi:hypothetical protein